MITEISSHSNPRYKALKSLAKTRNRKKDKLFVLEGRQELRHAFSNGHKAETLVFCPFYTDVTELQPWMGDQCEVISLSKALFEDLAYQHVTGNFLAVLHAWENNLRDITGGEVIVVLERVEKPGNLGAIFRTCDAAGVKSVIVSESDLDLFNPNVIRNSRGALFTVDCFFATNEDTLAFLKKNDYTVYCAGLAPNAESYQSVAEPGNKALVFGPESTGLSSFWMDGGYHVVQIPMRGQVDSLNLSVSVGILLYQTNSK